MGSARNEFLVALMIDDLPLFASRAEARSRLEKAFWEFHRKHPSVYRKLVCLARQWKERRGVAHLGIATLYEAARWTLIMDDRDESGIKLNNNHRAFFARLIMEKEPDLSDFFQLRRQKRQSTIGPSNGVLQMGGHRI